MRAASTGNPRRSAASTLIPASSSSDRLNPMAGSTRLTPLGYSRRVRGSYLAHPSQPVHGLVLAGPALPPPPIHPNTLFNPASRRLYEGFYLVTPGNCQNAETLHCLSLPGPLAERRKPPLLPE